MFKWLFPSFGGNVLMVVSPFWLLWIMLQWTLVYMYPSPLFHSSGYVCRNGISGSCGRILCLAFWETARLFSRVASPLCFTTTSLQGFQFLYILTNACYFLFIVPFGVRFLRIFYLNNHMKRNSFTSFWSFCFSFSYLFILNFCSIIRSINNENRHFCHVSKLRETIFHS